MKKIGRHSWFDKRNQRKLARLSVSKWKLTAHQVMDESSITIKVSSQSHWRRILRKSYLKEFLAAKKPSLNNKYRRQWKTMKITSAIE